MKKIKFRKFKIVEQIIIVLFIAVLAPLTISAIIVNNVNQHAVRAQLQDTALLLANMVSDEIDFYRDSVSFEVKQLATQLKFIPEHQEKVFLENIISQSELFSKADIVNSENEVLKIKSENLKTQSATISEKINDNKD